MMFQFFILQISSSHGTEKSNMKCIFESPQTSNLLALLQCLIEAITQGQIGLGLGALNEALDLPGASTFRLLLLLSILRLLLVLLWWLLVLFSWLGAAPTSLQRSGHTIVTQSL